MSSSSTVRIARMQVTDWPTRFACDSTAPLGRTGRSGRVHDQRRGVLGDVGSLEARRFLGDQVLGRLVPVRVVPEHHHLADPVGHLPGGLDQRDQRRIREDEVAVGVVDDVRHLAAAPSGS